MSSVHCGGGSNYKGAGNRSRGVRYIESVYFSLDRTKFNLVLPLGEYTVGLTYVRASRDNNHQTPSYCRCDNDIQSRRTNLFQTKVQHGLVQPSICLCILHCPLCSRNYCTGAPCLIVIENVNRNNIRLFGDTVMRACDNPCDGGAMTIDLEGL